MRFRPNGFGSRLTPRSAVNWGDGYFAGNPPEPGSEEDGRSKIMNAPASVRIGVFDRRSRALVAQVSSDAAGRWTVSWLDRAKPYFVVGFDERGEVNAAIQDWVYPEAMAAAGMSLEAWLPATVRGSTYKGYVSAYGARGPVTFSIASGSLPPGVTWSQSGRTIVFSGTPTASGSYSFQVTAGDGVSTSTMACRIAVDTTFSAVRVVATANNGDVSFVTIAEMQVRATVGGANQCAGGGAFASSFANVSNTPELAFDGNATTKWTSASRPTVAAPQTLGYSFPSPVAVGEVTIIGCISGQEAMGPKDFTIEGCLSDGRYTPLATLTGVTGWVAGTAKSFVIT